MKRLLYPLAALLLGPAPARALDLTATRERLAVLEPRLGESAALPAISPGMTLAQSSPEEGPADPLLAKQVELYTPILDALLPFKEEAFKDTAELGKKLEALRNAIRQAADGALGREDREAVGKMVGAEQACDCSLKAGAGRRIVQGGSGFGISIGLGGISINLNPFGGSATVIMQEPEPAYDVGAVKSFLRQVEPLVPELAREQWERMRGLYESKP